MPADFDVHASPETELDMQAKFRVRMRFFPEGAYLAHDDHVCWGRMQENPDGSATVEFPAANLEWAARTALSYGGNVEVIKPQALRQRMQNETKPMADYSQKERGE